MNEADEVYAEVERRKKHAWDSGIINRLPRLYREYLRHYPSWLKHCPRYIHPSVTGILEPEPGQVRFTLKGNEYVCAYKEEWIPYPVFSDIRPIQGHLPTHFISGDLHLFFQGQKVLEIRISVEEARSGCGENTWEPRDVEGFIEGPWVQDLIRLADNAEAHYKGEAKAAERERGQDPKKLADLKKRFGL
ncbi:MAG: hypothetical protein NTZ98_12530 [Acidobacteria bacterium]|nr:hypothetical protein [Acidobacteriota bacterium]